MTDEPEHTFLFADLAGFTALTEAHGDEHAVELVADFADCLRGLLAEHGAEEVKTIGDAMMLRCRDPVGAIDLGLRIVEEIASRPQFPIVRVGMHTGPAIERDGDWFGAAVNVAARVSGAARGGEVLLTDATRLAAGDLESIELRTRGEQRFKNVKQPIRLFQAGRQDSQLEALPVDPVCRMAVDPADESGRLTFAGREYHFCSLRCAQAFAATPGDYVQGDEE